MKILYVHLRGSIIDQSESATASLIAIIMTMIIDRSESVRVSLIAIRKRMIFKVAKKRKRGKMKVVRMRIKMMMAIRT